MPGRGPAPGRGAKPEGQTRRRNKKAEARKLPAAGRAGAAPKLGRSYRTGEETKAGKPKNAAFLPATRAWFDDLVRSPEGSQFSNVDVGYLRAVVAPLVDQYLRAPTRELAAELRLQLTQFGSTPDAKKRLGWEIHDAAQEPEGQQRPELASVHRLRAVDPSATKG